MYKKDYIGVLDLGSYKIAACIAEIKPENKIEIRGWGESASMGIKAGVVRDIEEVAVCIKNAVLAAEEMSGLEMPPMFIGITGAHIQESSHEGMISLPKNKEISTEDVEKLMHYVESSISLNFKKNRSILHTLPKQYIVEDQGGIKDPVGMRGSSLKVEAGVITAVDSIIQNIIKTIQKAGYKIREIVLGVLATSWAALTEDEKELGVALIDIGATVTNIAVFVENALQHLRILEWGGEKITKDVAIILKTSIKEAERLKQQWGSCLLKGVKEEEFIEIKNVGDNTIRTVPLIKLVEIIEARAVEYLEILSDILKTSGFWKHLAGIVLTGGCAQLRGLRELTEEILNLPTRIGYPKPIEGLFETINTPAYTPLVGLLLYGYEKKMRTSYHKIPQVTIFSTIKKWLRDMFKG